MRLKFRLIQYDGKKHVTMNASEGESPAGILPNNVAAAVVRPYLQKERRYSL